RLLYGLEVWWNSSKYNQDRINRIFRKQIKTLYNITAISDRTRTALDMIRISNIGTISSILAPHQHVFLRNALLGHKVVYSQNFLSLNVYVSLPTAYNLRRNAAPVLSFPRYRYSTTMNSILVRSATDFNELPNDIRNISSETIFKSRVKDYVKDFVN